MTTEIRDLPTLYLDQTDVNPAALAALPGERFQRWFIYPQYVAGESYWMASRNPDGDHAGYPPVASVTTVLPRLMVGDPGEIREDIRAAVERHATKHLGDA
jgi:hypothetical protein